jgi:hypothetical protein
MPLYEGLAAGYVSTEANIWISNTTDGHIYLFVARNAKFLSPYQTLQSSYLDPVEDNLSH